MFFGGLNAASTLAVIVVVLYGARLTITGFMSPGALTSFILYSLTGNSMPARTVMFMVLCFSNLNSNPVYFNFLWQLDPLYLDSQGYIQLQ